MITIYGNIVKEKYMLGENIRRVRKRRKLTQDRLARVADIPYTTLTKIETGVIKQPSVQVVAKIAKALNILVDDLIKE
jgi:transcriptional regulator with XRE-family HTH domain